MGVLVKVDDSIHKYNLWDMIKHNNNTECKLSETKKLKKNKDFILCIIMW